MRVWIRLDRPIGIFKITDRPFVENPLKRLVKKKKKQKTRMCLARAPCAVNGLIGRNGVYIYIMICAT